MAQETDNIVLQMLRDIRATLAEHSRYHEEHRTAFAEIRDELRRVNQNAVCAMGFSTLGQRDGEFSKERVAALEAKVRLLEERDDRR